MDIKNSIDKLITGYLEDNLTESEMGDLYTWMNESEENARYFVKMKDLWETMLLDKSEIADTRNEWNKIVDKINTGSKTGKEGKIINWRFSMLRKIAVLLVLGAMVAGGMYYVQRDKTPEYITCMTPKGATSQILLPDSSVVNLNNDTKIKYKINGSVREVFLEGEAWFEVAKNKDKSFIVHTGYYDVKVTGTKFNVKAYRNEQNITTTLKEGKVYIISGIGLKLSKAYELLPGEQFIYNKDAKTLSKHKIRKENYFAWHDNKLIFNNLSLKELFKALERRYNVEIIVENNKILNYHYSGIIKDETIVEVLNLIKSTLPIKYEIINKKIIVKPIITN